MKTKIITAVILLILCLFVPTTSGSSGVEDPFCVSWEEINPYVYSDEYQFKMALGNRESRNCYTVVNRWGYLGRWQFSMVTLRSLGYTGSRTSFLNSPDSQDYYFRKLIYANKRTLQPYINTFDGETLDTLFITESGILAAALLPR